MFCRAEKVLFLTYEENIVLFDLFSLISCLACSCLFQNATLVDAAEGCKSTPAV